MTTSVAAGDVNGDGDIDVLIANYNKNQLMMNEGYGAFVEDTSTGLNVVTEGALTYAIACADYDYDGDIDCVMGGQYEDAEFGNGLTAFLNDGEGGFLVDKSLHEGLQLASGISVMAIAIGDLTGDGFVDMVICSAAYQQGPCSMLINDGAGSFSEDTNSVLRGGTGGIPTSIILGDVNGDQHLDIMVTHRCEHLEYSCRDVLYTNDGTGGLTAQLSVFSSTSSVDTGQAAFGDLNADGLLDVVFAVAKHSNRVYLNSDTSPGTFTDATWMAGSSVASASSDETTSVVLADFDGDGDLDSFWGNMNSPNRLFLGDGTGAFTEDTSQFTDSEGRGVFVLAADVDNDGDVDLWLGKFIQANELWINDGRGQFSTGGDIGKAIFSGDMLLTAGGAFFDADNDGVCAAPHEHIMPTCTWPHTEPLPTRRHLLQTPACIVQVIWICTSSKETRQISSFVSCIAPAVRAPRPKALGASPHARAILNAAPPSWTLAMNASRTSNEIPQECAPRASRAVHV